MNIELTKDVNETIMTISDNGPGIPEQELSVLEEAEETALQYWSGVDLWVVDRVRRNSEASIQFETSD